MSKVLGGPLDLDSRCGMEDWGGAFNNRLA